MSMFRCQVKVKRVKVVGLLRTKADIVAEQVKDVLKAKTLQEALIKSLESKQRLSDLEIFKNVSIHLDAPKNGAGSYDGMEVTFHVKEYRMLTSSVAANAGTQSGDAVRRCSFIAFLGMKSTHHYIN